MTLEIGTIHSFKVKEKLSDHYVLGKGSNEVPLPVENVDDLSINDEVQVFLYTNRQEKMVATTKIPHVTIGVYGWVEVVDVIPPLGVFLDIGTDVEVLLPNSELPTFERARPLPKDKVYVTLTLDKQKRLLCHLAKEATFDDMIRLASSDVNLNDKVNGKIIRTDREGAVLITEENYRGFIHHTEREREPRLGQSVSGRVIEVKENGTLNVSLLPMKHERLDDDAEKVFAYIEKSEGVIPFSNKSDPNDVRETFQMSKSAFKRALGKLMKEGKVEQRDGRTWRL